MTVRRNQENIRRISFAEAIHEALDFSLAEDDHVFLMGEGIDDPAAFFGTTKGLGKKYGPGRAVEMPVAENAMVGVAVGAAMFGQRPVISLHRVEFALLAIEQIVNNAAKSHYVSNGKHSVPLVIRLIVGRGWGQGPEHSQSLEVLFGHFPGLKVIVPTMPSDAKGMLIAAVQDNNPVLFIEHRWLHYTVGHVPVDGESVALDGPKVLRPGGEVTLLGISQTTLECLRAADVLAQIGVQAEVMDLRVVRPLIDDPIVDSARRTGHLLTVDMGWQTYGVGAEICARTASKAWGDLKSAPRRLGLPEHPTPSSRGMVPGFYADSEKIIEAVADMLGLSADDLTSARRYLEDLNGDQPIDTPNAFFKGPF